MKHSFLVFFVLFLFVKVNAQNLLEGSVTDENNQPLPGAAVYFPDLHKGATADKDGNYKIIDLPSGKFLIEVRFIGYSIKIVKVNIEGMTHMDFILEESHMELNEVIITGSTAATEKAINPVQTVSISEKSLKRGASTNIIDAVSKEPGISQITTGVSISKPVIRGLGYNRVVVLQNNIRQEGQQWGDEHGIEIDEFSIDRAEVIKGPGSLVYGSDAMAGVINFLPPEPEEMGKITAGLLSSYNTNNKQYGISFRNAGNLNGIHWRIQLTKKEAGNYSNANDGKVFNSGFNETNINGSVGISKKWGYTNINFSAFDQNLGLVEGERDSLGNFLIPQVVNDTLLEEHAATGGDLEGYHLTIPRQRINHYRVSSTSNIIFNNSRMALTLGWQQNNRREYVFQQDADKKIEQGVGLYFQLNTFNYDLTYFLPEIKGWETSVGINGFQQTNSNKGVEFLIPDYSLIDGGIFAITRKSFNKLYISGGLRYNFRSVDAKELILNAKGEPVIQPGTDTEIKFTGFSKNFSSVSYSVGGSYSFTKSVILKLNVSSGFRAPNMAELGSNGHHEGTFRYEIGNPDLKPETSVQLDGGFLVNTNHVSFELDAFSNSINHFIFVQKLNSLSGGDSLRVDEGDSIPAYKFVQGNARLLGGEITLDIHPHPLDWLHFENTFAYVQGIQLHQTDSTKYLPFMPAPKFHSELRAEFKKAGKLFRNLYAYVELDYYFAQNKIYSAFGTETPTPSYYLFNAGLGTDVVNKKGNTLFSFYFVAANLFDRAYQDHLSRLKYAPENPATGRMGVFNMGRNFNFKLIIPLVLRDK